MINALSHMELQSVYSDLNKITMTRDWHSADSYLTIRLKYPRFLFMLLKAYKNSYDSQIISFTLF